MALDGDRGADRPSASAWLRRRTAVGLATIAVCVTALAALIGAFDGPDRATAAPTDAVAGHVFRVVAVEQDGQPMPLFDGAPTVWLAIDRRSFGLYAGCNHMGGSLRLTPSRLRALDLMTTQMACPGDAERRDELLSSFLARGPAWKRDGDRLVLVQGTTTVTLERDDLPPALPQPNPSRARDLIDASLGQGEYQRWPRGIGESWRGPFVTVDFAVRDGRPRLTMRARCRQLEAPVRIQRSVLIVGTPRTTAVRCRSGGSDHFLDAVRPFFGGRVQWHLDGRHLTLQRDRATLTLRVR